MISKGSTPLKSGLTLAEVLCRPEIDYLSMGEIDETRPKDIPADVAEQIEIEIKYEGYINRQNKQVEQFKKIEGHIIPREIDYDEINNLRMEARQKLKALRPINIGQASRISGVSPADISVLLVYLNKGKSK